MIRSGNQIVLNKVHYERSKKSLESHEHAFLITWIRLE